jgi:hypothetical protein
MHACQLGYFRNHFCYLNGYITVEIKDNLSTRLPDLTKCISEQYMYRYYVP